MDQMKDAIDTAFKNIVASGLIEKTIEEKLTETIKSAIDNQLRQYSDFGKAIEQKVKELVKVDLSSLGLEGYNDFVMKIIRKNVAELTDKSISTQIENQLKELLAPAPEQIELSKLVANFIAFSKENDLTENQSEITLIVEHSSGSSDYRYVCLDAEPNKSAYQCKYRIGVTSKGDPFSMRIDDEDMRKKLFVGSMYSFERDLFQMHVAGTKIIFDKEAHEIDICYPFED
jgi:hypothetical protein